MQTRPAPKKASQAKRSASKAFAVVFVTLLILLLVVFSGYAYYTLNLDTVYPGIKVDGIDLGGLTRKEAVKTIWNHRRPDLECIRIALEYEGVTWEYGYNVIEASVDVEDTVDKAYHIGRQGSIFERLMEILRLRNGGKELNTTLSYDVSKLQDELESIAAEINLDPVDASITFNPDSSQMFTFSGEADGRGMLVSKAMEELEQRIDAGDYSVYKIPIEVLHPTLTLDEVKTWTSKLAEYSTIVKGTPERIHNVVLSSKAFHGVRLDPGEVYSMNDATGPRDKAHGYLDAPVIKEGKKLVNEPGGGNCQSSSTLYSAVMRADMEIVERWNHSWPSTYIEIGQDATINYPTADIKFKNNKDTPFFIRRTIKDDPNSAYKILSVEVYGKKSDQYDKIDVLSEVIASSPAPPETIVEDPTMYEGEELIEYSSRAYYKVQTYRVYYKNGKEVKRIPEALSVYPKVTGKKRVGTKPRPLGKNEEL